MEDNNNRSHWLHVRLTAAESKQINLAFKGTTETKKSEYIRKIILQKPMIAGVRDQSLQDILTELMQLRKDFNGIANNFNQAVKRLHVLKEYALISQYLVSFRLHEKQLLKSVEEMRSFINKTQAKWLRS